MKVVMPYICGGFAAVVFAVGLVIHVSSFITNPPQPDSRLSILMAMASLVAFGTFVVIIAERSAQDAAVESKWTLRSWFRRARKPAVFQQIREATPRVARVAVTATMVYVFGNFFWCMYELREGQPTMGSSGPHLNNHGEYVRPISIDEYRRLVGVEMRLFSGHWIIFALVPAIYFFVTGPRMPPMNSNLAEHAPPS